MALGIDGVRVGTWTSPQRVSGCTVVLPPNNTVGALAVRGAAPGTREAAALSPAGKVAVCHGVVLAGSSAFGLAAADGVMRWLESQAVGYPVAGAYVPIVGGAILLDGGVRLSEERPDAQSGWLAAQDAQVEAPEEGAVGAGTGCTVAKTAGLVNAKPGGQGWSVQQQADLTVGALVANNALGEVVDDDGTPLVGTDVHGAVPHYPTVSMDTFPVPDRSTMSGNTVIGCIVTNAQLDKAAAYRVADLAHTGIARAVRPAHTVHDGDALFCLATGPVSAHVDLVVDLAIAAVAEAARRGPLHAKRSTKGSRDE